MIAMVERHHQVAISPSSESTFGGNFSVLFEYAKLTAGAIVGYSLSKVPVKASCIGLTDHSVYDLAVVGGGIVGVAIAREVARRHPNMRVVLLEKELMLASHQSGMNSNVIHAGLYYKPKSLKARLCVEGSQTLYQYMDKKGIKYNKCGKVVVAVTDDEVPVLNQIYLTALTNKVKDVSLITPEEMQLYEPHCVGKMAIRSPHTGVVDFNSVARSFGTDLLKSGGRIIFGFEVSSFDMTQDNLVVLNSKDQRQIKCRQAITCCGLQADRVAQMTGCSSTPKIIPFRTHYLLLKNHKRHLIRGNIYPVPNMDFPFLGVHFTPRMDGSVWLGPFVTPAFSRDRHETFNWEDAKEILSFKGFRKMVFKHWWYGSGEVFKIMVMRAQLKQLQKYIPELTIDDISSGPTGTAAHSMHEDGTLVPDFCLDQGIGELGRKVLHVRNSPSPAATSSMAIASYVTDKAEELFRWEKQLRDH